MFVSTVQCLHICPSGCVHACFKCVCVCVCVYAAEGLDSRLEFSEPDPARYTLLLDKPFPELHAFTIALWLYVYASGHQGSVLSYSHGNKDNILQITSGPTLRMKIHDEEILTDFRLNVSSWMHLAWTWTSDGIVAYAVLFYFFVNIGSAESRSPGWIG